MRMWLVNPKGMCTQHLLGEHVELHMFVGTINKGMSLGGYVANRLVDSTKIVSRHSELVQEMERRKMNHASPLRPFVDPMVGKDCIPVEWAYTELFKRCAHCKKRFAELEKEYDASLSG